MQKSAVTWCVDSVSFSVFSLHVLFDAVNAQNILGFIRDIGLYRLL